MLQPALRKWLGATVLGSALVVGCSHSRQECTSCSAHQPVATGYVTTLPAPTYRAPMTYSSYAPTPAAPVQPVTQMPAMKAPATLPAEAPAAVAAPAEPPAAPVSQVSATVPAKTETLPASYSLTGGEEKPVERRSYADITKKPCYDHASDYSWVSGELQFVHVRNEWRVRYASVEEEDRFGGSLTLTEMGPMTDYHDGQTVRVQGQVMSPDSREPVYRVGSIQVLSGQ